VEWAAPERYWLDWRSCRWREQYPAYPPSVDAKLAAEPAPQGKDAAAEADIGGTAVVLEEAPTPGEGPDWRRRPAMPRLLLPVTRGAVLLLAPRRPPYFRRHSSRKRPASCRTVEEATLDATKGAADSPREGPVVGA